VVTIEERLAELEEEARAMTATIVRHRDRLDDHGQRIKILEAAAGLPARPDTSEPSEGL
jgi:hypothetical protein